MPYFSCRIYGGALFMLCYIFHNFAGSKSRCTTEVEAVPADLPWHIFRVAAWLLLSIRKVRVGKDEEEAPSGSAGHTAQCLESNSSEVSLENFVLIPVLQWQKSVSLILSPSVVLKHGTLLLRAGM